MSSKILLVQNDTRPLIVVSLTDDETGLPVELIGATAKLYFRAVGSTSLKDTLNGQLLAGIVLEDGSIDSAAPYNVPGSGGRLQFPFNLTTLDAAGAFEGEIEVTFADAGVVTLYDKLKFKVREDIGP